MSVRILGIELRRSSASVTGAVVAVLGTGGLYVLAVSDQAELWDAQWTMLAVFQRIMLVVLWPLALGAGAWQARRDRRCRMEELLATVSRPTRGRALPTSLAMGAFLLLGYLVIFAAGAAQVAGTTAYVHIGWLPIAAVGALSLVAAGWVGMGIGRLVPSVYTPPVLVVAGFLVLMTPIQLAKSSPLGRATLLAPNVTTTVDEFTTVAGPVSLAQAVWFVGLALGGLALVLAGRRRTAILAAAPVVLGLVVAVSLVGAAPASGLQPDPVASAEVCTQDGGPTVCVTRAHEQGLAALVGPARRALTLLAPLPDPPTSVHEVTGARAKPQPVDEVWLHSDNFRSGHGWLGENEDELVVRILAGAGTSGCRSEDYRPRAVVAAWLYGRYPAPGLPVPAGTTEAGERDAEWRTLQALPAGEQVRRVAAVREAGLTCQADLTAALHGSVS
jgi:hypothetical protein